MKRGGRINPVSAKTRGRIAERKKVREQAIALAQGKCQMAAKIPEIACYGPLEVDEIQGRGVRPGSQYDVSLTQVLCREHHRWKTTHPALATERGLTIRSSFERDGLARRLKDH